MRVSCLCVCHNKPELTHEAIGSIVRQTFPSWEAVIVDSGVLYDAGYYERFGWLTDPRIKLIRSPETAQTRRSRAMAPWCFNECFRRRLVTGDLVMYLCDDDVLYPRAFETFVSYCRRHPSAQAMYASQDLGVIYPNGWHAIVGERRSTQPGGRCCGGVHMDHNVDYLQLCHKADVLKRFPDDEFWPEAKETEEHADGIFLERIGAHVPIHPIDVKVSQNRRTARSTYAPLPSLGVLDCIANGVPLLPSVEAAQASAADSVSGCDDPLVTVSVAYHNHDEHLAAALASLAAQTYPRLEVLVIDDGSTAPASVAAFEALRVRHPEYRFLRQPRAGRAATRNRGLAEARGTYFIPLDAGHQACPDMVERLVARMRSNPRTSAVACYLLAHPGDTGSPRSTGIINVCGHALFNTEDFRAVGGFDDGPDFWGQDWSGFFKLVNTGRHVDLLPEHLVWQGLPDEADGMDRFQALDREWAAERIALWNALARSERRGEELVGENAALQARLGLLRYRIADRIDAVCKRLPLVRRGLKWLLRAVI